MSAERIDVLAVKNPYHLRRRATGYYVVVLREEAPIATHWTASENTAREHVRRQGHYGVRMVRAERVELLGVPR